MKIDKYTEIFNVGERHFLFNFKTGAMDEVEEYLINEFGELKNKGSFTSRQCKLKESLLEEMAERGYITYYSDKEEEDERRWLLEGYKEKAINEKKTASLLIDAIVGRRWCCCDDAGVWENEVASLSLDRSKIGNILNAICAGKLADEVNLWLLMKNREDDLLWLKEEAGKKGVTIRNIYTYARDEAELLDIKTNKQSIIPSFGTINIKYKPQKWSYLSFSRKNGKDITEQRRAIFLENHPFFCPFIYRTFFVDMENNVSHCVKKLAEGEKIGNLDIGMGQLTLKHGWGREQFTSLCDQGESCICAISCQKSCSYLSHIYEAPRVGNECNIASAVKRVICEKIKSMM